MCDILIFKVSCETYIKLAHRAEVRTHISLRIEPAQKWQSESCIETIHGNSPISASQQSGQWGTRPERTPHSREYNNIGRISVLFC